MKTAMLEEAARTRLIGELAALLRRERLPDDARAAGLTLIGWLARRMPGEGPSQAGVVEMRERAACLLHTQPRAASTDDI
jgi:hypothetical protein